MANPNKKRLIQNLLLLVVVASLVAFVMTRKEEAGEQHQTLYDMSIGDEAKEIIIHSEGREDVVLQERDDVWLVVKPEEFVADKAKIQHLFTLLSENADSRYSTEGKDLESYGLDKDRLSVSFNGVKIIFGKFNEVTRKRFIKKGNEMFVINETVSGLLEMGAEGFKPETRPELTPVTQSR